MKDRIALVLDTSGSMGFLDLFTLGTELDKVEKQDMANCRAEKLQALAKEYRSVIFITDGILDPSWSVILNSNIRVIQVDPYHHKVKVI